MRAAVTPTAEERSDAVAVERELGVGVVGTALSIWVARGRSRLEQ